MRYCVCSLLIVLAVVLVPALAWGRSEHHNYRNRERMRQEWRRQAEQINKLQRRGGYPYFRLDVF